jgi:hypothetical protein
LCVLSNVKALQALFGHNFMVPTCLPQLVPCTFLYLPLPGKATKCSFISYHHPNTSYVSSQSRNSGVKYEITIFAPALKIPSVLSNAIVLRSKTPAFAAAQIIAYSPLT